MSTECRIAGVRINGREYQAKPGATMRIGGDPSRERHLPTLHPIRFELAGTIYCDMEGYERSYLLGQCRLAWPDPDERLVPLLKALTNSPAPPPSWIDAEGRVAIG